MSDVSHDHERRITTLEVEGRIQARMAVARLDDLEATLAQVKSDLEQALRREANLTARLDAIPGVQAAS